MIERRKEGKDKPKEGRKGQSEGRKEGLKKEGMVGSEEGSKV